MTKEIFIFPYINNNKIIKMDDFEIHPYEKYIFDEELMVDEKNILNEKIESFRKTFFEKGNTPKLAKGIGILKYNGTIFRNIKNSEGINDRVKILFLLLKLHISHDFFNPGMNFINLKSFDIFVINLGNKYVNKFGNVNDCNKLYSTVPENINGLSGLVFYPLEFCINTIPVDFKIAGGGDEIFGVNPDIIDLTKLYKGIINNEDYYKKFLNLSSVHYGLEHQNDLFFYYSIIPSIIEVLNPPGKNKKKKSGVNYGKKLDNLIINNDYIDITTSGGIQKLGIIARTISIIYDTRNELLHEGKKSFNKLKVQFKGYDFKIYDVFQLIFKYTILNDFIEKGIIYNSFTKLEFSGSIFTTGVIDIISETNKKLYMDEEIIGLLEKAKSDKNLKIY